MSQGPTQCRAQNRNTRLMHSQDPLELRFAADSRSGSRQGRMGWHGIAGPKIVLLEFRVCKEYVQGYTRMIGIYRD